MLLQKKFSKRLDLYHSISSVIAEDQNVDRRGVIGHANSSFPRLIFPVSVRERPALSEAVPDLSQHNTGVVYLRVVIADGGREPPSTDPEAHHMDPFAEPGLCPKPEPHTQTNWYKCEGSCFHQGKMMENDYMVTLSLEEIQQQWFQQPAR